MPILHLYENLQAVALAEFADIVDHARILTLSTGDPLKLRLDAVDGSLIDVFLSSSGKYSYHWERRLTPAGDLYRHDNAPLRSTFTMAAKTTWGKATSVTFLKRR